MKYTSTTIAILALLSGAAIATPNCLASSPFTHRYCDLCYESKPVTTGFGCGPKVSDNCLFYHRDYELDKTYCAQCKVGYSLQDGGASDVYDTRCVAGQVQDCVDERSTRGESGGVCISCGNGKYSKLNHFGRHFSYSCISVSNKIANCIWGGRIENNQLYCNRCANGYTISSDQRSCQT